MRRHHRKDGGRVFDVQIERMGVCGDGLAILPEGTPVFIPFSLSGKHVRIRTIA